MLEQGSYSFGRQKNGKFIVEVFWLLKRSKEESECNLKLVEFLTHSNEGFTMGPKGRMVGVNVSVPIPVACACKHISKGEELVLWYTPQGRKREPAVKIKALPTRGWIDDRLNHHVKEEQD